MRILVAEDDPMVSVLMEDLLGDDGHEVLGPVTTSQAALGLAEQCRPDLLLVDINLADGPSGCELVIEAEKRLRVPALFVTGSPEMAKGCDDAIGVLAKPFHPDSLTAAMRAAQDVMEGHAPAYVPKELQLFPRWSGKRRAPA